MLTKIFWFSVILLCICHYRYLAFAQPFCLTHLRTRSNKFRVNLWVALLILTLTAWVYSKVIKFKDGLERCAFDVTSPDDVLCKLLKLRNYVFSWCWGYHLFCLWHPWQAEGGTAEGREGGNRIKGWSWALYHSNHCISDCVSNTEAVPARPGLARQLPSRKRNSEGPLFLLLLLMHLGNCCLQMWSHWSFWPGRLMFGRYRSQKTLLKLHTFFSNISWPCWFLTICWIQANLLTTTEWHERKF